jgi:hypothetical protein
MRGQEEMGLGGRDEDNRLNGEKEKEEEMEKVRVSGWILWWKVNLNTFINICILF